MDEQQTDAEPKQRWWSRLRAKLRGEAGDELNVASDGMLPGVDAGEDVDEPADHGGPISRWSRREQALQKLQEGTERLEGLTATVEEHMAAQQARTQQLTETVGNLDTKLDALGEPMRQQLEITGAIASQLETANRRAEQLMSGLGDLPQTLEAQRNALKEMAQQLALSNESTAQLANSLSEMGNAMQSLTQLSQSQSDALRRVEDSSRRRDQVLTETLQAHARRLTALLVVALVMAAGGLIVAALAIWFRVSG